ncbi:MAG: hypothetical protein K9N06_03230 [Candidatus Cloacimonetes bacterium]|nr:hypothetical protein [Candidatus Cloacimonadota bacterium]
MTIKDLIPIGKLGIPQKDNPDFLLFKPDRNFLPFYFSKKEFFLIFADYRVRFVTIDCIREDKNIWLSLVETDVTDEVREARKVSVCLPAEDIEQLHSQYEDDYIIGLTAVFNDAVLGKITDVQCFGATDLIVVETADGREVMIPDVEQYVVSLDKKAGCIVFRNIEDLLNL